MVSSRPVPQHTVQISPVTAGQYRRGRRVLQILHAIIKSSHMPRTDLFIKVEIEHDAQDSPERLAAEICRNIQKVYGVLSAELSNYITH